MRAVDRLWRGRGIGSMLGLGIGGVGIEELSELWIASTSMAFVKRSTFCRSSLIASGQW